MTLSDIKFKYLGKIQNIDSRMERYGSIIQDYDKQIKRAENEEKQNIDSVLKAKSNYEKRIENMSSIKAHYQEFVDTSDELMQYINKDGYSLLKLKYEQLMDKNQSLTDNNEELNILLGNKENDLERYKTANENNKRKLIKLKKDYEKRMDEIKTLKERIKAKDEAYSSLRDRENEKMKKLKAKGVKTKTVTKTIFKDGKSQIRKLSAENQQLQDTNDFLEGKCQRLEEYCNELLNR